MEYHNAHIPAQVLPDLTTIERARSSITTTLPHTGIGTEALTAHLHNDISPGLNAASQSSRYYGFVTGGCTSAAHVADNIVTDFDQNVQVHLPNETIATDVEHHALTMLCELIDFDPNLWKHRTFTTGATASNIMGLAAGREYVIKRAAERQGIKDASAAKQGLLNLAHMARIQILTTVPHSSIRKAASITGLGHDAVIDCSDSETPYKFNMAHLTQALGTPKTATIIMVSCCEVNAGMFALESRAEWEALRRLADQHDAWIHVDAAMGFMARLLSSDSMYTKLREAVNGLELADSVTGDGHKLLNVPYDTGFFLSRHLDTGTQVFQNPNAAYLSSSSTSTIPSPLNIGMENSRRFRALPVYANLVAYGREGYRDMIQRQVEMARTMARYFLQSVDYKVYQPWDGMNREEVLESVFMIVLFTAKDEKKQETLVKMINDTRKVYCSGTQWRGRPAARFAVANWQCDVRRDWPVVEEVLNEVAKS